MKKSVHNMKVNNELKLNVAEQEDDIKYLKEYLKKRLCVSHVIKHLY